MIASHSFIGPGKKLILFVCVIIVKAPGFRDWNAKDNQTPKGVVVVVICLCQNVISFKNGRLPGLIAQI